MPETRRYRITVNGYENRLYWNAGVGVRFDYRLIGEFALVRPTPSEPWAVSGRRVVTADLTYAGLYPRDRCELALTCQNRACRRLPETSTLRLQVRVDGDEIVAGFGYFSPDVLVAGTCTRPRETIGSSYVSHYFDERIGGARLPLQDLYVGPQSIARYGGRSDVSTSFAYGLERLP